MVVLVYDEKAVELGQWMVVLVGLNIERWKVAKIDWVEP